MEGPKNSALLGAMSSVMRKLDELPHMEGGARQLRDDLGSIRAKLEGLSEVHDPPLTVSYWTKDARELSYDMDDFISQFILAGGSDAETGWVDEISGFKARAEELRERYDRYKLEYVLGHTTTNTVVRHLPKISGREREPVVLVGMDGQANEILLCLKPNGEEGEEELKVVSILGVEGVGKSTLAQKLWRELEGEFECQAFVQTARKPDMKLILRSILSQIRPKHPPESWQVPNLIQDIRSYLQDKRYFIVIDDLWAVSVWDVVSRALPEGNYCSRIIATTTIEDVALACCSYNPDHIFKMKPLSDYHSRKLFISNVVGSGLPQQFSDFSDEIIRKCCGLPLAIICIATLVSGQLETIHQWEWVQNFLSQSLRTNATPAEILTHVLKFCFSSLSNCLKTCLLYLSVYPENYLILKDDLVRQWIAEDFICATEGKDIVQVASSYFDELVSLGLIQQIDIYSNEKGLSYAVHPMVFDFITRMSVEDNFIITIDYSQSTIELTEKIRRLALHFGSATYATTPGSIGLYQVHSLSFIGLLSCMPSLVDFKLVRVVVLHFWADDESTRFSLSAICELFLLRYLQVRCNVIVELPDQMQCLKYLEILEINAIVEAVPLDVLYHPSLLHVHLGRKTKHRHLTRGPVTSDEAIFLNVSSSSSSPPIQLLKFLPPICIFSRLPVSFKRLRGLRILEVVVRELWRYDVEFLADLPALTDLCVYVRTPGRVVMIRRRVCPALKNFKLVSGRLLLRFWEEAMPNLQRLEIAFNVHQRGRCRDMFELGGIQHLPSLQEVVVSIGATSGAKQANRIAAESAFRDAIAKHPCRTNCKIKWVDPIDEEGDHSEIQDWSPVAESSNVQDEVTLPPPKAVAEATASHEDLPAEVNIWGTPSLQARETAIVAGVSCMVHRLKKKLVEPVVSVDRLFLPLDYQDIMYLEEALRLMENDIQRCESMDKPDTMTRVFLSRVRELAYDIEDWVDLLESPKDAPLRIFGWFSSILPMSLTMEDLKARITELNNLWNSSKSNDLSKPGMPPRLTKPGVLVGPMDEVERRLTTPGVLVGPMEEVEHRPTMPNVLVDPIEEVERRLTTPDVLVGLDGPMEEVAKMVTEAGDKAELKVVSIVGMAGSGKTSLARAVYQRLRQENCFQCWAFVYVGQTKDVVIRKTLRSMQSQLGDEYEGGEDIRDLIKRLREILDKKRYLIVVDDLWSREDWEAIKCCFPENRLHSRIITTTRNAALAADCSCGSSSQIFKLGLLSDDDSKKLFLRVIGSLDSCPPDLEGIFTQIMRRCSGLPLALVTCASILEKHSKDEWERLIGSKWLQCPEAETMTQILNLSYNNLPPYLKTCLLYLSIFPENYEVEVERLVRRWISEAFKEEACGRDVRAIAGSCLSELINRNMVQPLHVKHDGLPRYCRVHPVIHDFIVNKSEEQNFVTLVNAQHQNVAIRDGTIRRLCLQSSSKQDQALAQNGSMDLSHARSINVFGQASAAPHLTDLRVVRVLDLEGCDGPVCLDGLEKLLLLRYLSLRGTDVSEIPDTIGELRCLQTLDVRSTKVKELPRSIVKLKRLLHLLSGSAKLPCGVTEMKALQNVSCAIVTNESTNIIQELNEIIDLKELELFCDLTEIPKFQNQATFHYGFGRLRKLCIHCHSASVTFGPRALRMVRVLELSFEGILADESSSVSGIEHLTSLRYVLLEFSKHSAGAMATADAVRRAASTHPNHPVVTVTVEEGATMLGKLWPLKYVNC